MTASSFNWLALMATIAACSLVDGGVFLLAWWFAGDLLAGVFGFFIVGGPFTLLIAGPTYAWFKGVFGGRVIA